MAGTKFISKSRWPHSLPAKVLVSCLGHCVPATGPDRYCSLHSRDFEVPTEQQEGAQLYELILLHFSRDGVTLCACREPPRKQQRKLNAQTNSNKKKFFCALCRLRTAFLSAWRELEKDKGRAEKLIFAFLRMRIVRCRRLSVKVKGAYKKERQFGKLL